MKRSQAEGCPNIPSLPVFATLPAAVGELPSHPATKLPWRPLPMHLALISCRRASALRVQPPWTPTRPWFTSSLPSAPPRRSRASRTQVGVALPRRNTQIKELPVTPHTPCLRASRCLLPPLHDTLRPRTSLQPSLSAGLKPRPIKCVAVLGGGLMGSGIATALVLAGYQVLLKEVNQQFLDVSEGDRSRVTVTCRGVRQLRCCHALLLLPPLFHLVCASRRAWAALRCSTFWCF